MKQSVELITQALDKANKAGVYNLNESAMIANAVIKLQHLSNETLTPVQAARDAAKEKNATGNTADSDTAEDLNPEI